METETLEGKLTAALFLVERLMREAEVVERDVAMLPASPRQAMLLARATSMKMAARRFLRGDPAVEAEATEDFDPPTEPGTPRAKSSQRLAAVQLPEPGHDARVEAILARGKNPKKDP
jgi:hypothetical protein